MTALPPSELVLALYPASRGLTFVLFEGPLSPIDWAVKDVHNGPDRSASVLEATRALIERYQPDIVVLQGHRKASKRPSQARRFEHMIASYAASQTIDCYRYTREEIRACFRNAGAVTRYEIAQAIAAHIPALSHRLPPMKKLWQSEDGRMCLFDAASLALTYFCNAAPCSTGIPEGP